MAEIVEETEWIRVVKPYVQLMDEIDGEKILRKIELCGRVAYKSEHLIGEDSHKRFVKMIIERGHESVIEHVSITVKVICDRGVSHEIVRHRIASYTQESTRFCNYAHERFGRKITVIMPSFFAKGSKEYEVWKKAMEDAAKAYFSLIETGRKPQEARAVLPNSLKTEIVMTMNLREWRHFFKLRTASNAHPQMQEIAKMILAEFKKRIPIVFDDL